MKILRKALCFLSIIALLSIFSAISVSAADYTEGYYTYTVSNGEATIVDVNSSISGNITIPATLGGYPVTTIGGDAFAFCSNLTGVTIPNGVTYVATWSFRNCSKLAEITIPPSLQSFGAEAFEGCTKLKTVNISDLKAWCESDFPMSYYGGPSNPLGWGGLLYLNGAPVSGDLIIPDGTKKIGDNVFFGYDNFTSLTIPQSVESFGHQAFTNCRSLEAIYISNLRQWCEFDFSEDIDNPLYYAKNLYLNGTPVAGEVVIPPGTKSICTLAFYANQSITKITIPDSVKTIGERAFYGCKGVTTLELGNGLESVGERAFELLSSLKEVNIHDIASWCQFGFSLGYGTTLSLNGEPISGRVEIPNGTVEITDGAFQYCKDITEVIIPTSVVRIGKNSFASCYGISNIDIYGSPTIGDAAFGWISGNAKISFYGEPQSIYSSQYTIYDGVDIWCYSDNSTVESYASKYGRQIHYFPCKDACSYVNIVNESYLKSEGSCTTKAVYYQSCEICLNASDSLTFEDDFCHSYYERPVADCLVEAATCTEAAVYYISCNCGTKNTTQTFVYGDPLGHSYDDACDESCERCTFVREAPHNIDTAYEYDSHHHWNPCLSCELLFSYVPHRYDGNHDTNCNDCGRERVVLNLHYDANGGENPPAADYIPLGSAATVSSNVPTKDNFVFVGWATNANGVVEYEVGDTLTLTESITLYAVWKAECQECGGTGKQHTTRACTSCESGYVYSASCYYCYGRGKYSTGDMSCSNCYGSGQVKDPYGSGKYVNCLMCGGDGLVPDYETCYHCRSKCTICNGSTKITDYFDCENCDALGYFDSFEVHYDANGGSGAPNSQTMGGKFDTLSEPIPTREDFVFVGWNTLTDNNAVYQPGAVYRNGEVTFYAMWVPVCHSCAGEGHFTAGNTCGSCNGNGSYKVTVKICNSCGGNHVVTHVTGYGTISYCSNCGSTSVKTSTQTKTCYNCTNGIVSSTYECEDCEGRGYLLTYPKALSFTDSKVVLLKIDGMEYSIDGISWQESNIFTDLLPGMEYSFYQRMKATENAPFGFVSAPLLLRTDKADNEDTPPIPVTVDITAESIRVELLDGCEYSIDGANWQSDPFFVNLDCATNYTVYARFAETDTHYASQAISYTVVRTEKGTVSAPSMPTLVAVGRDRVILQKLEGYEYSIDDIHWQSSNAFLGLESKTNYFFYCRFASTDRYYASAPSEALTVKTLAETEIGPTYQITFQDEYGNILSQASYELYDEIVIPSTLKESDLTYTYTFIQWDKPVSEFCMGEAVYTATYEKKYIDYEVVFKNDNGDIISSQIYHYGDSVIIPTNPTKESDFTYTYIFAGWDNSVVSCAGNATYTATYTPTYNEYTVVFKDYDGETISSKDYHYGDTVTVPSDPTRVADNTYTYAFAGWDANVASTCGGFATYTATYTPTYIDYTVIFKDYDGETISTNTYHYGDAITIPTSPTRETDVVGSYTFKGWDQEVVNCAGDATYTATYNVTYANYTVVFKNYNGDVLSTKIYHYGDEVVAPTTPTKAADNTYTYTFKAWDKTVVDCAGDETYTATYDSTYIDYTVIFKSEDGTVLSTKTYHYGDEVTAPTTPTKTADNTYTYTFKAWDKTVVPCAGDATYTATYDSTYIDYTVIFKNEDGTVLNTNTYHYGDTVVVPSAPSKPADETYTYVFIGWDNTVTKCEGNATYTAKFAPTNVEYTVVFKDENGTIISTKTYYYGEKVVVPSDPTKAADNTYTYTFAGWDKEVVDCVADATYTATYTPVYINYAVTFTDYDGSTIKTVAYHYGDTIEAIANPPRASDETYTYAFAGWDKALGICSGDITFKATYTPTYINYTVIFKNEDDTVLSTNTYHYGDIVTAPATPTKIADNTYTYTFAGWDSTVVACNGDKTYTATYTPVYIEYTVVFKNYDGSIISSAEYHYGQTVTKPSDPTREADNTYTYTFAGWDKTVTSCTESAVYTATYSSTYIEYEVVFKNYDGTILSTNRYHYGDTVAVPETPTKPADASYTYGFAGWDSEVTACSGNKTYTATFNPTNVEYTVVFKDYNGNVISSETYRFGEEVTVPSDPTRAADNTYTYTFKNWGKTVTKCVGNAEYTAVYTAEYIEYTVTFLDWDGSLIQTVKYHYGDTIVAIADPERASDETYTYTFLSWNKAPGTCTGNASFTAQYESTFINYTVVFKDYDGSVISRKTYHFGDTITIPADPIRASDETYTYTFKDWGNISTSCNGNKEYTAVYNSEYIEYTVEFKDHNGNTLSSKTYHYGDEVAVPSDPAREADNTYTYAFADWDKEIVDCVANATYTATYTPTFIEYTVVFKDYDGTVLGTQTYHYGDAVRAPEAPTRESDVIGSYVFKAWNNSVVNCAGDATYTATYDINYTDYTVIFKNEDGTVLSTNTYHYGDEVTVPTTPTKASDNTYTYAFKAWNAEVVACAGNATYIATYDSAYIDYTVIFKNEDGTVLSTGTYHYGDAVTAPANPTKENDNDYTYIFKGWDKEIVACEGDATYTATYTATEIEDTTTPGTDTEPDINPDTDVNTPSDNDENDNLSGGAVAGIAAGSAVVVGGGGFALWWFVFRKKRII